MLLKNPVVPLKCEVLPGMNTPHEDVDFNVEWEKMRMAPDDRANDGQSFSAPFEEGYTERIYGSDLIARGTGHLNSLTIQPMSVLLLLLTNLPEKSVSK